MSSIIDIHPHIVSPDTKKYPLDPLGGTQSTWSTERPTTYDDLLRAMDEAGVAKAAIVHSSTAYGYDNSYVADAVAAVPSRFTGVYSIDVLAPDAVKTFDDWLGRGDSPEDKRYRNFFSLMGDPLPYGMAANRPSIEALVTYALQQELIPSRPELDRVFVNVDA